MSRYHQVDTRLWNDSKFLSLSNNGRMLWMFFLTTPLAEIPGVVVASQVTIADKLGVSLEGLQGGYAELYQVGLSVRFEEGRTGAITWLPNAVIYQKPTSPTIIQYWAKIWNHVPEIPLRDEILKSLRIACDKWLDTFDDNFKKWLPDTLSSTIYNTLPDTLSGPKKQVTSNKKQVTRKSQSPESELCSEVERLDDSGEELTNNIILLPVSSSDRRHLRRGMPVVERIWYTRLQHDYPLLATPAWDTARLKKAKKLLDSYGENAIECAINWCFDNWNIIKVEYKWKSPGTLPDFNMFYEISEKIINNIAAIEDGTRSDSQSF